jgi:hypothetical protein
MSLQQSIRSRDKGFADSNFADKNAAPARGKPTAGAAEVDDAHATTFDRAMKLKTLLNTNCTQ